MLLEIVQLQHHLLNYFVDLDSVEVKSGLLQVDRVVPRPEPDQISVVVRHTDLFRQLLQSVLLRLTKLKVEHVRVATPDSVQAALRHSEVGILLTVGKYSSQ